MTLLNLAWLERLYAVFKLRICLGIVIIYSNLDREKVYLLYACNSQYNEAVRNFGISSPLKH